MRRQRAEARCMKSGSTKLERIARERAALSTAISAQAHPSRQRKAAPRFISANQLYLKALRGVLRWLDARQLTLSGCACQAWKMAAYGEEKLWMELLAHDHPLLLKLKLVSARQGLSEGQSFYQLYRRREQACLAIVPAFPCMDAHLDEFVLAIELRDAGSGKCCWCSLLQFEAHKVQTDLVLKEEFAGEIQPLMRYDGMEVPNGCLPTSTLPLIHLSSYIVRRKDNALLMLGEAEPDIDKGVITYDLLLQLESHVCSISIALDLSSKGIQFPALFTAIGKLHVTIAPEPDEHGDTFDTDQRKDVAILSRNSLISLLKGHLSHHFVKQ